MSSSWVTIEQAIQAWCTAATGLDVIWSNQDSPRPSGQYIALQATATSIGRGWTERDDADAPLAGAEVTSTHRTVKRLDVEIQCFGGTGTGTANPANVCSDLADYAGLPSQKSRFKTAKWSPVKFDPVQNISGILNGSTFEPRAVMRCHGYIVGEISETSTYIQIVQVTNQITGDTFSVDAGAPTFPGAVRFTESGAVRFTESGDTRITE